MCTRPCSVRECGKWKPSTTSHVLRCRRCQYWLNRPGFSFLSRFGAFHCTTGFLFPTCFFGICSRDSFFFLLLFLLLGSFGTHSWYRLLRRRIVIGFQVGGDLNSRSSNSLGSLFAFRLTAASDGLQTSPVSIIQQFFPLPLFIM